MHKGTLIDDLIRAVQQVEAEAKPLAEPQKRSGMIELQMFMRQMYYMPNAGQVGARIAS